MYIAPLYHWPAKSKWNHIISSKRVWGDFSIYLHYPYCRKICDFCGYETRLINKAGAQQIPNLFLDEITNHFNYDDFSNAKLNSIFFGGGTASLMKPSEISKILKLIEKKSKNGLENVEITLECEPGTVDKKRLQELKQIGVNRISVCAQSFSNDDLKNLTRMHSNSEIYKLVEDCVSAGFENIHLDLIFGIPGQTLDTWLKNIEIAISLPFVHLSMYRLYVFKYGKYERNNIILRPDKQPKQVLTETETMFNEGLKMLEKAGFKQYSLSEYAKDNRKCKYLLNAFDGSDILPIGPSAFGGSGSELWENSPYVHKYSDLLEWEKDKRVFNLNNSDLFKRKVILGLWLLKVNLEFISKQQNIKPSKELLNLLNELSKNNLICFDGKVISLLPEHRYNVGLVMEKLDELDSSLWISNNLTNHIDKNTSELYKHPDFNSLNSIIRMSRRDPDFYYLLKNNPRLTISNIDVVFDDDIRQLLINVISDKADFSDQLTDIEVFFMNSWKDITNENNNKIGVL